jgi:hypothetical protein
MGDIASYRLVYFQPDAEDGERVSVALLFNTPDGIEILSYPDSPRLRCLAPQVDPYLVRIYLEDLKQQFQRSPSQVDSVVSMQSPHLAISDARKVTWPLSDKSRLYLMKRFLGVEVPRLTNDGDLKAEKALDQVKEHLRQLIYSAKIQSEELRENATPAWVFGQRIGRKIKSVAFGLRKEEGVVLIDGVDLSVSNKQAVAARVGKVAYAFFQYERVRQMGFADRRVFQRVGVILNGAINPGPDYKDSHDFALQEFSDSADLTIDASSTEDVQKFRKLLSTK